MVFPLGMYSSATFATAVETGWRFLMGVSLVFFWIALAAWLAVRTGDAAKPDAYSWRQLAGAGALAGIGFTMSLFIAELALEGPLLDAAKIGVLSGSALAAVVGMVLLLLVLPKRTAA